MTVIISLLYMIKKMWYKLLINRRQDVCCFTLKNSDLRFPHMTFFWPSAVCKTFQSFELRTSTVTLSLLIGGTPIQIIFPIWVPNFRLNCDEYVSRASNEISFLLLTFAFFVFSLNEVASRQEKEIQSRVTISVICLIACLLNFIIICLFNMFYQDKLVFVD